jgi:hypothetical protein
MSEHMNSAYFSTKQSILPGLRALVRTVLTRLASMTLMATLAFAQQADTAIVVGSVTDGSQGAVVGAAVSLRQTATNASIEVRTDDRGQFRTPPLKPGSYSLVVEAAGFKQFNQKGLELNIGDVRQISTTLEVGQVTESVSVEAAAPLLQAADSTVGTVITNRQIADLPLNGRDYLQLAALSGGTTPATGTNGGISIGGQAGSQAAFLLDGQDNNNQQITTGHSGQKEIIKPSVDAIQEFKVVTNGYSAEYGRSSSGVISVALKSGTNSVHGTAYEFLRNEALDARNFFAPTRSPYKRNQYGASVGGKVIRDKVFYFGDFELARQRETLTTTTTVPTLDQLSGKFSRAILDPSTGQPFANNQIPDARIDPIARKILAFYPAPQNAGATNNYVYASPRIADPRRWDFRIDDIISEKQNVYFRYSSQVIDNGVSSPLPPSAQGYYAGSGAEVSNGQGFILVHNRIWTPTLISSLRAGWNNLVWNNTVPDQPLKGLGIPGVLETNPGFSQINITGYQTLGVTNVPNNDGSQNRQLSGDLTWTKSQHTIKFGYQGFWLQTNFFSSQRTSGIFSFNGQYTKPASVTASPLADFLLGDASSGSLSRYAYLRFRTPYTHFFVQDDWKLSRRLTLNIGLRYELSPPAIEKQNQMANFDLDSVPGSPKLVLPSETDRASRALQGVNHKQFAPRFGLAYSLPDNKTVIRAGYGLFYSNMITLGGMSSMEINPPYHLRVSITPDTKVPSLLLKTGYAVDALSFANGRNVTLVSYDRGSQTPLAQQWNLDIQRQLKGGILLEVGYYGNKFDHNWRSIDGNPAPPGPGTLNPRRLYTSTLVPTTPYNITLADVVRIQKDGYSRYHALQAKFEKRYSKGITLLASYSYSKTIALGDTTGVQNPLDWRSERAVSSQDMTHRLVASTVYQLPFGRNRQFGTHWNSVTDAILGGWSLSPILTASTGLPVNLTVNGTPSNSGQQDRPNVVGDWHLANPTVQQWFNTSAFVANAAFTYGNAGRNVLRAPGLFNLDLAALKNFRFTERISAQLRLESFNATNTPAFGAPNAQVGNALFGQISSAGTPRDNQIGLKLIF